MRLGHSSVRYRSRTGRETSRYASNIDGYSETTVESGENVGYARLKFEVGEDRGYAVTLNLHSQDYRKMLNLMVSADHAVALREMADVIAKALKEESASLSGSR